MNIAFLTDSLRQGGSERTISTLANMFVRQGHAVSIYVLSGESQSFFKLDPEVKMEAIQYPHIRFVSILSRMISVRRLTAKEKIDCLITMDTSTLMYGVVMKIFVRGVKLLYSERSNPDRYPQSAFWRRVRTCLIPFTDMNIFQTCQVKKVFAPRVQKHSVVIPNGIFNESIMNMEYPGERENVITAMGRLSCQIKGFDMLLRAFSKIAGKYPDTVLRIYGHGPDEERLLDLARELGVERQFQIIKGNENAIVEIARSQMFVFTSLFEGFPNALLEAMACGLPCISFDCKYGPGELIRDGVNGLLLPEKDEQGLSAAMDQLLSNPDYAEQLGKEALQTKEKYNIGAVTEKWLQVLENL